MSIIYDALKKVEQSLDKRPIANGAAKNTNNDKKKKFAVKTYLIYALIIGLGFISANLIFNFFLVKVKPAGKSSYTALPLEQSAQPSKNEGGIFGRITEAVESKKHSAQPFVLTGVFFSGDQGYALINNRVVTVGDTIKGATVTQISLDEVELKLDEQIIKLPTQK